uniref:Uncharacterized protein n=1 Tax=Arundo donax TaxID=35708 RepID=A0A0A8Z6S5_ARUDO
MYYLLRFLFNIMFVYISLHFYIVLIKHALLLSNHLME